MLTNAEGIHTQREVSGQRVVARTRTKTSTRGGDQISRNYTIVDREMFGKLQSAKNELRFEVGTVLTVHKFFVFRLLIFKQHG